MDTSLTAFLGHATQFGGQQYILSKIITAWERIQEAKSGRIRAIIWNLALIAFWWYSQNPASLPDHLKRVGWYLLSMLLYRKRQFSMRTPGVGMITGQELTRVGTDEIIRGLPMYVTTTPDEVTVLAAKFFHTPFLSEIQARAEAEHLASLSPLAQFSQWNGIKYELRTPTELYPSPNFRRLEEIIRNHVLATQHLRNFNIVGILIDGEPGLGKSMAIHYLATSNVVRRLYRVDLIDCLKKPMDQLFRSIYHQIAIAEPTVFLFDEIDKWLSYQESDAYRQLTSKKPAEDEEHPTFEAFSRTFRTDFLYALLSILERVGQTGVGIVIFCSNNFDSIFGDLDMTHFHSLRDRFQRLTFERYSSDDVAEYLRYNNHRFLGSSLHVPDLELMLTRLPTCSITARKLNEITILRGYNPAAIISTIGNFLPSAPVASSSSYRQTFVPICRSNAYEGFIPGPGARTPDGTVDNWPNCIACMALIPPCACVECEKIDLKSFKCHWCVVGTAREYHITEYIPDCTQRVRNLMSGLELLTGLNKSADEEQEKHRIADELLSYLEQDNVLVSVPRVGFARTLPATDEILQRYCYLQWKWYTIPGEVKIQMAAFKAASESK